MPAQRHYPNAPITEAIIDLRVELPQGITVADLEKVHLGHEAAYPTKTNRTVSVVHGEIGQQSAVAATRSTHIGFLFASQDRKNVFQARLDGFTMSRLAPYERWEPFRDEARRLWDVYRSVAKPTTVTRLAVRYMTCRVAKWISGPSSRSFMSGRTTFLRPALLTRPGELFK